MNKMSGILHRRCSDRWLAVVLSAITGLAMLFFSNSRLLRDVCGLPAATAAMGGLFVGASVVLAMNRRWGWLLLVVPLTSMALFHLFTMDYLAVLIYIWIIWACLVHYRSIAG